MQEYINRGNAKLKRLRKTSKRLLILFIISFLLFIIAIIYKDMMNNKDLLPYCYAFFAGNAIAANGMFSLGRSNIILKRNDSELDKKIHFFGFYFLISAIMGFFACGIAYLHLNATLPPFKSELHDTIVFLILSFFLTTGASFSFLATCSFLGFAILEIRRN